MSFGAYLLYIVLAYLRPIEMLAPDLAAYRPMLILWVFAFVTGIARALKDRQIAASRVNMVLLGLFVTAIAISSAANGWFGGMIVAIADFSASAMLFVLTVMNLTSVGRVKITALVLLACLVTQALLAILAYHYGFMADQLLLRQNTDVDEETISLAMAGVQDSRELYLLRARSLGFLNDPNDFAQAIIMVLPFLWNLHERGHFTRFVFLGSVPFAILSYAVYLTHSRGAILGAMALMSFFAHRKLGTTRVVILLVAAVAVIGTMSIGGRGFSGKEESAGQRIEAWWAGLQMLKHQPIFGVGYGNFTDHHYLTAHNSFVLGFAELGLVGYFLWIALLVVAYKGLAIAIECAPPDTEERKQAMLLRSSFVGFLVCSWFLSRTYQPGLFVLLAMCSSIAWCTNARYAKAEGGNLCRPLKWRGATVASVMLSMLAVYGFVVVNQMGG